MSRENRFPYLALLAAAACSSSPQPQVAYLSPADQLVRTSMALRGLRPSLADLATVRADAGALPGLVDTYLASPEFGETMRDLHNEALLVRTDSSIFPAGFPALGPVAGQDIAAVNASLIEEPLKLIEHVIMNDRPYTEIVTANYAYVDSIASQVWGATYNGDGTSWAEGAWGGGHPAAGVLSSPILFTRHATTISNANRGRANEISKAFLCYDFTSREVELNASINLADPKAVATAVQNTPACASCHQTLDPLAAFFVQYGPIYVPAGTTSYPLMPYAAESNPEPPWVNPGGMTHHAPAYFGIAATGLANLGQLIAHDDRFSLCAAKRFYAYFTQTRLEDVPLDVAAGYQKVLVDSGMNAKALARAIVLSDAFRTSYALNDDAGATLVGLHKARPEELARMVADLTGFRWKTRVDLMLDGPSNGSVGTVELTTDSFLGFKVQAGGIDSYFVTLPSYTYNATASLFLRSFSEEAANFAVESDFSLPAAQRKLLTHIEATDTSEASLRAQLADLHDRIFAHSVDPASSDVTDSLNLFNAALALSNDSKRAWKTTLAAMLQDFSIAYY
jgi:hypothetical protein